MPEEWTEEEKAEAMAEYDAWLDMVRELRVAEEDEEIRVLEAVGDR